jgi:hypothetical protein
MSPWRILDYVEADGANVICFWIDSLPIQAQVRIDTRIRYLEATAIWPAQYISALKTCHGIYELKIVSSGVQYRPLGYFGPSRQEFTLLMGSIEKGGELEPRDFRKIAERRREVTDANRKRVVPHQY